MSSADEQPATAGGTTSEGADEPHDAVDPATVEGLQEMDAAQAELQRQLRAGEVTQDAYDEALTSLIETAPAAVLKASMERRQDDVQATPVQDCGVGRA